MFSDGTRRTVPFTSEKGHGLDIYKAVADDVLGQMRYGRRHPDYRPPWEDKGRK